MKKRILSLVLCLLLVLPSVLSLTGCADEGEEYMTDANGNIIVVDDSAITVTLYGITDDSTTDEAIARVEEALNQFTKSKYSIQIKLCLYPEAEYYEKLEASLEKNYEDKLAADKLAAEKEKLAKEKKKNGETETEIETETETETGKSVETFINANGLPELVYPEVEENQVDVFLINGYEKYCEYDSNGWLTDLTTYLAGDGLELKSYIYPHFLTGAKSANRTVKAIPNNGVIGEYTYLLVNRELCDKYYYDASTFTELEEIQSFLEDVMAEETEGEYLWMLNEPDPRFDLVYDDICLGAYLPATGDNRITLSSVGSILHEVYLDTPNVARMKLVREYTAAGNLAYGNPEDITDKKVACAFIKGSILDAEKYSDDYYTVVYSAPTANTTNTHEAMYAISSTSKYASRVEVILSLLTTNEDFINTYTYGVEGVDYTVNNGIVKSLNSGYSMNYRNCGNAYMIMPSEAMDEVTLALALNNWELGKAQNRDSRESEFLGFSPLYFSGLTEEELAALEEAESAAEEAESETEALSETETEQATEVVTEAATEEESVTYAEGDIQEEIELIDDETTEGESESDEESESETEEDEEVKEEPFTKDIILEVKKLSAELIAKANAAVEYTDEEGNVVTLEDQWKAMRTEFGKAYFTVNFTGSQKEHSIRAQFDAYDALRAAGATATTDDTVDVAEDAEE